MEAAPMTDDSPTATAAATGLPNGLPNGLASSSSEAAPTPSFNFGGAPASTGFVFGAPVGMPQSHTLLSHLGSQLASSH